MFDAWRDDAHRCARQIMDFKSLKRQRDGKAKRGDVKAKAAALRQAKLEAEAAARRDAEKARAKREAMTMPPPPPRATAAKPKATKKVASLTRPAPATAAAPPAAAAGLPAGFFDASGATPAAPEPTAAASLVAYGSDDDDDGGGDAAAAAAAAAAPAAAPASAEDDATAAAAAAGVLPAGFFDNADADLRARGIDPEKKKAKDESAAWAEFQEFAGGVREQEAHDEAAEATEADDEYERRNLDQAWYESRLAPLLARADKAAAPSSEAAPRLQDDAEAPATEDSVVALLKAKKRAKKEEREARLREVDDAYADLGSDDEDDAWQTGFSGVCSHPVVRDD